MYEYDGNNPLRPLARLQNFSICPMGLKNRLNSMKETILEIEMKK